MRAWLVKQRYEPGDLRSEGGLMYPQMSEGGHLSICKWLFEVGAAADITKANGVNQIRKIGVTPMYVACRCGHLPVCEWLFEGGAAADIAKEDNHGDTPMRMACRNGHLSVCKWLVFNGALNLPAPPVDVHNSWDLAPGVRSWAMAYSWDDPNIGHIDRGITQCDTQSYAENEGAFHEKGINHRPALLAWAQDVAATHRTFLHIVLRAGVLMPAAHQQASPDRRCHLPLLPRVVLERLGLMLGVEMGRRARNVREFAELLWGLVEHDKQYDSDGMPLRDEEDSESESESEGESGEKGDD